MQVFQCETCPVIAKRRALSESNARALRIFDLLARRVVQDFRLERLVFDLLRLRLTADEAELLIDQLDVIYAARVPVSRSVNAHA